MPVYIELETDPFTEVFSKEQHDATKTSMSKPIRRPMRGVQPKPDTYSYIRVVDSNGSPISVIDAGGENVDDQGRGTTDYYTNFLIQSVSMPRQEKQQIIETFGEDYLYMFGDAPRVYTINALLMNTLDFNWFNEFWYNYENYLRGTKLVERGARAYIFNDDMLWECYIIGMSATKNSANRNAVPIQLTVFVVNDAITANIGDPEFPNYPSAEGSVLQNVESYDRLLARYEDNREIYWDTARTSSFMSDLYTILTTGELTYSRKFKRDPSVPIRSMIRDNYDEYIGAAGPTNAYYDQQDLLRMQTLHMIKDFAALSSAMLQFINGIGGAFSGGSAFDSYSSLSGNSFGIISTPGSLL